MALVSPGVEVTITDQSQYLPAPTNSVPLVLLATAQNKANPNGTGVAAATTAANAGKLFQVTSQRDLVTLYGTPFFYTTTNGTPIQGYELNEYGLLAAYSLLGVTNRCYVLRADIDLSTLVGRAARPVAAPSNNTWWLDTTNTQWGVYEFNATTGQFAVQTPIIITETAYVTAGVPVATLGNIGDYAVVAYPLTSYPSAQTSGQYFFKGSNNVWVPVGSTAWMSNWPTIQGSNAIPGGLTHAGTITVTLANSNSATITVSIGDTLSDIVTAITDLNWTYLTAAVVNQKLCIYSRQTPGDSTEPEFLTIAGTTAVMTEIGLVAGAYNQPELFYGTAAQQPLWQSSQEFPRPTGSVWIKVGAAGNGLAPVVEQYKSTISSWIVKNVSLATSDWAATASLDPSGGQSIAANTVYAQYAFNRNNASPYNTGYSQGPVYLWERIATGPTVVTGTVTNPSFASGPYTATIQVSRPGSNSLTSTYNFSLADNSSAADFVTAWSASGAPYTTASVTTDGAIQLVHTEGGEIIINDFVNGVSNGLCATAGFIVGTTSGVKYGPSMEHTYTVSPTSSSGPGTNLTVYIASANQNYYFTGIDVAGSGYSVGDTVTFSGASLGGTAPANNCVGIVTSVTSPGGNVTGITFVSGTAAVAYTVQLSNWRQFDYTANEGAPVTDPANGTNWFYSVANQVDIMINYNGSWTGYRNQGYDENGFPSPYITPATDPAGPIISASTPTTQSDGTALVYGDLWIDTTDLENYPMIFRWQSVDAVDQWVLIDNTDQVNPSGILFADARWATSGDVSPTNDPIPTIASLLDSDYLDLDAPTSSLYPVGMLLFNTRRSGYNVKQFMVNYFNNNRFPGASLPVQTNAWVSESGLMSNGAPYMGRKAQRAMVVKAMRSTIDTNLEIRDEDNFFNLMATPNYPELQPNMVVLNADRGETGYILGDTPLGLPDSATAIQAWATNAAGATSTGEEGLVTRNTYLGLFYPSGLAPDLSGNLVAVPASHMMLRTFLRNDTIAYPWLAAAGTRRGIIENATNIGYVDRTTGEFQVVKTRLGLRDTLYTNFINPLVFFTNNGLLNYGNKTSYNSQSALDRTNVARLVAYIRRQLTLAGRPFVFEPNDALTRQQIAAVIETLMIDLVAKRGIYDYLVQCDDSNNTPARIDRNELWVDVAVEPVKAAEFIYIPVRILNTGEIGATR